MPGKRKKEAEEDAQVGKNVKKSKRNTTRVTEKDTGHSVLGGLKGGFRITGDEATTEPGKSTFKVPFGDKYIICERRNRGQDANDQHAKPELIFTHGAGGGISNPATASFADGFSTISPVVCFQGTMNLQSRVKTFHAVIEHEETGKALGGRSMGARAAVITALESEEDVVDALVLVSYPLVGAGKGDIRDGILLDLGDDVDVLFIVGSEDTMCRISQLNGVREKMTAATWLVEVESADHGMSLKSKKGVEPMRQETGRIAAEWLRTRKRDQTYRSVQWDKDEQVILHSNWSGEQSERTGKGPQPAKGASTRKARK